MIPGTVHKLLYLLVGLIGSVISYAKYWDIPSVSWYPNEGSLLFDVTNEYLLSDLTTGKSYRALNSTKTPLASLSVGTKPDPLDAALISINDPSIIGIDDISQAPDFTPDDARILNFNDVYFHILFFIRDPNNNNVITKLNHWLYEIQPTTIIFQDITSGTDAASITKGCGSTTETRIDVLQHNSKEYFVVCGKIDGAGYLTVGVYWTNSSSPSTAPEIIKRAEFSLQPEGVPWTEQNTYDLRVIRLDAHPTIQQDVLFYRVNTGLMYYNSEFNSLMTTIKIPAADMFIFEIQQVRSKFLLVSTINAIGGTTPTSLFIIEYRDLIVTQPLLNGKRRAAMDELRLCLSTKYSFSACGREFPSSLYLNNYYMTEEDEYIFEMRTDVNSKNIDVYRYSKQGNSFDKVIENWPELVQLDAQRFPGKNCFIQLIYSYDPNAEDPTTPGNFGKVSIDVYMSPRRYLAKPKKIHTKVWYYALVFKFRPFFVEKFNTIYLFGNVGALRFKIEDVVMNITRVSLNSSQPEYNLVTDSVLPNTTTLSNAENFFTFDMQYATGTITQTCGFNSGLKMGSFFFQPSTRIFLNMTSETDSAGAITRIVRSNLPSGIGKDIDLREMFKGSFLSITIDQISTYATISDTYLDPFVYKLRIRKTKYMESIYGFDVEMNSKRRVHFMISTMFDNIVYSGDRFQIEAHPDKFKNYTMRDYRGINNLYPMSDSSLLVQVQELSYAVSLDKTTPGDFDVPSMGVNGVCSNATVGTHEQLGRVFFCMSEGKTYVKIIQNNQNLTLVNTHPDAQAVINSMRVIRFIKSSDAYRNMLFVFYQEKPDPSQPNKPDYLLMAVFTLENVADTRLAYVNKFTFSRTSYNVSVLSLEVAGTRMVHLEKSQAVSGEVTISVYYITSVFNAEFLYTVSMPSQLSLTGDMTMYLTTLQNEADKENHLNTVINSQSKDYQISIKIQSLLTKEVGILVINPALSPFDSITLIQIPQGYLLVECGQLFISTSTGKTKTLALVTAKTAKLDDDYYSQDTDLYVFLVSDLSPSFVLKPVKTPDLVLNSQVPYPSTTESYSFNGTTSLLSNSSNEEDRRRIAEMVFDTSRKKFVVEYSPWGIKLSANRPTTSAGVIETFVTINTDDYSKKVSNKLSNFFFRLNPRSFINGTIINYSGKTESTVEDYMGIVKVLPDSKETFLDTTGNDGKIRTANDQDLTEFNLDWNCNINPQTIYTYNNETTDQTVRGCNTNEPAFEILSWRENIVKIESVSQALTNLFSSDSRYFQIAGKFIFYLAEFKVSNTSTSTVRAKLCFEKVTLLSKLSPLISCKTEHSYELPGFNSHLNLKIQVQFAAANSRLNILTGGFLEGTEEQEFIVSVMEYNKNIRLYSRVEHHYLRLSFEGDKIGFAKIGSTQLSSDHVQLAYIITPSIIKNPPFIARVFALYTRWMDGDTLTLFLDQVSAEFPDRTQEVLNGTFTTADLKPIYTKRRHTVSLLTGNGTFTNLKLSIQNLQIITSKQVLPSATLTLDTGNQTNAILFVLNFKMSNPYIVSIPESVLKASLPDSTTTLPITSLYVASVENPFIGFMPDVDTPPPFFFENYYFQVHSFKQGSYFLGYKLDNGQLKKATGFTNIMGIDSGNSAKMDTLYQQMNNSLQAFTVTQLSSRPTQFTVIPNYNANKELEHKLTFITNEEKLASLEFTSFINVRVQTHRIASRTINMTLKGTFNQAQALVVRISGEVELSWFKTFLTFGKFILIVIISLVVTVLMLYFMDKQVKISWGETKLGKMGNRLRPLSRAVSAYFTKQGPQTLEPQKELDDDLINSSEDSGEEDTKKPEDRNSGGSNEGRNNLGLSEDLKNKLNNIASSARTKTTDKKAAET